MGFVNTKHCFAVCGSDYRYCRTRKKGNACFKLREVLKNERERLVKEKSNMLFEKIRNLRFLESDFFDSIGNDISKEEFLENEIFWEKI